MRRFPNIGGPQYSTPNSRILIIRGTPFFSETPVWLGWSSSCGVPPSSLNASRGTVESLNILLYMSLGRQASDKRRARGSLHRPDPEFFQSRAHKKRATVPRISISLPGLYRPQPSTLNPKPCDVANTPRPTLEFGDVLG